MANDDVIDTLNDLIETSKDGEYGFRTSAEYMRDRQTQQLLLARAEECRDAAARLQALVRELGGKAEDGGTAAGAVHRGWVAVKSKIVDYSDCDILEDTERAEDVAVARYRAALKQNLPPHVHAVVQLQAEGARRNHDQVRALRDQARALRA